MTNFAKSEITCFKIATCEIIKCFALFQQIMTHCSETTPISINKKFIIKYKKFPNSLIQSKMKRQRFLLEFIEFPVEKQKQNKAIKSTIYDISEDFFHPLHWFIKRKIYHRQKYLFLNEQYLCN